jgi:hypothetical protein
MDHFCDRDKFRFGEEGQVCWNRPGDTWADKVLDGVDLDLSLYWGSGRVGYRRPVIEDISESVIGERVTSDEVRETTKEWGKERGEGKFKRKKKIPQKNNKRYPTKPKPKDNRYRRLSKIAQQLDMESIGSHIEEKAVQEWSDFWDEILLQREQEEEEYWMKWEEEFEKSPGEYALISLKIPVNTRGGGNVSIYDVDDAGVNTTVRMPWHTDEDYDPSKFDWYSELLYFTYWDKEKEMYVWRSLEKNQLGRWFSDIFKYYPSRQRLRDIFHLERLMPWSMFRGYWLSREDSQLNYQIDGVSKWQNGIDWEVVWCVMDKLRTGEYRDHIYEGPDGFDTRSYTATRSGYQIPNIKFIE